MKHKKKLPKIVQAHLRVSAKRCPRWLREGIARANGEECEYDDTLFLSDRMSPVDEEDEVEEGDFGPEAFLPITTEINGPPNATFGDYMGMYVNLSNHCCQSISQDPEKVEFATGLSVGEDDRFIEIISSVRFKKKIHIN